MGVQEKCVKNDDEVARILQEMADAESQNAQTQQLMEGAKVFPSLNKKIEAGSPAELLAGAMK
jgi:ABC-type nitrate/sulfonate/bicarbonate transport system substrate-binding protein